MMTVRSVTALVFESTPCSPFLSIGSVVKEDEPNGSSMPSLAPIVKVKKMLCEKERRVMPTRRKELSLVALLHPYHACECVCVGGRGHHHFVSH